MSSECLLSTLSLFELTAAHTQQYLRLESNPEVVRYQYYDALTLEQVQQRLENIAHAATLQPRVLIELGVQASSKTDDNQNNNSQEPQPGFIGRVGCSIDLENSTAELWLAFRPEMQGQGYATAAVKMLLRRNELCKIHRLRIETDPRNLGARKLAERLGFRIVEERERVAESKGEWVGSVVYERDDFGLVEPVSA